MPKFRVLTDPYPEILARRERRIAERIAQHRAAAHRAASPTDRSGAGTLPDLRRPNRRVPHRALQRGMRRRIDEGQTGADSVALPQARGLAAENAQRAIAELCGKPSGGRYGQSWHPDHGLQRVLVGLAIRDPHVADRRYRRYGGEPACSVYGRSLLRRPCRRILRLCIWLSEVCRRYRHCASTPECSACGTGLFPRLCHRILRRCKSARSVVCRMYFYRGGEPACNAWRTSLLFGPCRRILRLCIWLCEVCRRYRHRGGEPVGSAYCTSRA
jgi:hypothetical protein